MKSVATAAIGVAVIFLHIAASAAGLAQQWPHASLRGPGWLLAQVPRDMQRMGTDVGSATAAAANGYLPNAAISDQQQAQSDSSNLHSELKNSTGLPRLGKESS
jgi:hypothetical protein